MTIAIKKEITEHGMYYSTQNRGIVYGLLVVSKDGSVDLHTNRLNYSGRGTFKCFNSLNDLIGRSKFLTQMVQQIQRPSLVK